nr:hypothetical protein [Tanacetum cinerariifolium]GEZ53314.1 hypothetical protein [Tanacetum cinerariifolium]
MDSLSRKACHVRLAFSGPCQHEIGLSSGLSYFSCLVGPGAHCDNTVQTQRPGIARLMFCYLSVLSSSSVVPRASATFPCIGSITDIKSVLTQKALKVFCETFHIPDEVHPQLPSPNQTIHEMPTGKISVYTIFFEYANFRLPLSTFLVNVLKHYRIHISQLSVIGAAKLSHFEIMGRVHGFEPTVDAFACPASFPWDTSKSVSRDVIQKSFEFNAEHYATLVAYPAPFHKYPEPFLCLVGMSRNYTLDENTYPQFLRDNDEEMDLLSFIRTANPTKVRISERQRDEDGPKILETTVGRVVPLLPVAPDHSLGELEASVDKIFDEGGSGEQAEQGHSTNGEQGVGIKLVSEGEEIVAEDADPLQPRRQKKRKTTVVNAGEPSHPVKRLRDDHGTPGGTSIGGKSQSAVERLLAGAVRNVEVRGEAIPTLPFVTSSVSATPEREGEGHTDSVTGPNLRAISAPQRFIISSDSSHHSSAIIAEAEVDSFDRPSVSVITAATTITPTAGPATVVKEKIVKPSLFSADSASAETDPATSGFADLFGSDFLVGGIRTVISPNTDLQKVCVPQWSVNNGSRLDDGRVCREMMDEFAPHKFFESIRGMEHDQLFIKFNVRAARQMSLSADVRMRAEYNIKEKKRLTSVVGDRNQLLKSRDEKFENLKAHLLLKEAKATEAIRLRAEASKLETMEKSLRDEVNALNERNSILEKDRNALDVKVTDLKAIVVSKERELTNSTAQLTSIES